ncbi:MAG: flagellar motor switch protein FliN [Cyanobacteria bacterium]|nr:flagellar motor switch protein FliN [Cyanobacteriota bacterium]MDA1020176.1 flagellar motor switch protein FliN [Cyanobacteriota bacterium]
MSLDKNQEATLTSLLHSLCAKAAPALSNLAGSTIDIQFNSFVSAKTSAENLHSEEELVLASAKLAEGTINLLFLKNDAASIAGLITGSKEPNPEFTESMNGALSSAITEALNTVLINNKQIDIGYQQNSLKLKMIDPNNQETLGLGQMGMAPKIALALSLHSESKNIKVQIEVPTSLIQSKIVSAASPSKTNKDATIGDVFGADFSEIINSHNPEEIDEKKNLNLLMDIRLGLIVELGRSEMHLKEILKLTKGSIIELDRLSGEPVDLFANNKLIARGEVVVIDDNFGLRITQLAGLTNQAELNLLGGDAD